MYQAMCGDNRHTRRARSAIARLTFGAGRGCSPINARGMIPAPYGYVTKQGYGPPRPTERSCSGQTHNIDTGDEFAALGDGCGSGANRSLKSPILASFGRYGPDDPPNNEFATSVNIRVTIASILMTKPGWPPSGHGQHRATFFLSMTVPKAVGLTGTFVNIEAIQ